MTKKEFVEKFNLTKTNTKALFNDGMAQKSRTIYVNQYGEMYVFYNNDLHIVRPWDSFPYVEGAKEVMCKLGAGYSWYH